MDWIKASAIALLIAMPATAQDTDATQDAPEQGPAEETSPQVNPNDRDFPVNPQPPLEPEEPQVETIGTFGDWDVVCVLAEADSRTCEMVQVARGEEGNMVSEVRVRKLPEGGQAIAGVTALTPFGTLLSYPFTVRIDGGQATRYPYEVCVTDACVVRFGLNNDGLNAWKRGAVANLTLRAFLNRENDINVGLSLTGFTAAFDALPLPGAEE